MHNVSVDRASAHDTVGRALAHDSVGRALARQITKKKNLL